MKKEPAPTLKKINSISYNSGNTNFNNYNVNSGNSKNGEKNNIQNIIKYDSSSNISFKLQESPVKNTNSRPNEINKSNNILWPSHVSPEVRRKKFESDVPEFKLDLKSN